MSGHTPGPWEFAPHVNDGGSIRSATGSVASVHFRENSAEHDANVRMIAAAPELLAALDAADAIIHAEFCTQRHHPVCIQITAAIAKAKGQA